MRGLVLRPEQRFEGPKALVDALVEAFGQKTRYPESRVREIVARASELEATTPTLTGALSLGGIQQLAADVGIPPEHVAKAAREVTRRTAAPKPPPKAGWFLGSPKTIVVERVAQGEVSEDEYVVLVDEVRLTVGNVGQASTLGRSLSWRTVGTHTQTGRAVGLSVVPANGQTRIRLEENLGALAGGLFGGLMGGFGSVSIPFAIGIAVEALAMPFLIPVLVAGAVGTTWGVARAGFRTIYSKRRAELEALADRLAGYVEETTQAGGRLRLPR